MDRKKRKKDKKILKVESGKSFALLNNHWYDLDRLRLRPKFYDNFDFLRSLVDFVLYNVVSEFKSQDISASLMLSGESIWMNTYNFLENLWKITW